MTVEFIKKVTQRLLRVRIAGRLLKEDGLINTTDLLIATAATVTLAAGIGGAMLGALDDANYGKAQPDAQTIARAITTFYQDTGLWPGQFEHKDTRATAPMFLATGVDVSGTFTPTLPDVARNGLRYAALQTGTTCANNSGQGFIGLTIAPYVSSTTAAALTSVSTPPRVLDLNDFLVRDPGANYPNWAGPYVQEIDSDPWGRSWVAYLTPLYCSEHVTSTSGSGNLGYAWLLTGGANRTITSEATDSDLDDSGDDAGVNMGKLTPSQAVTQ